MYLQLIHLSKKFRFVRHKTTHDLDGTLLTCNALLFNAARRVGTAAAVSF